MPKTASLLDVARTYQPEIATFLQDLVRIPSVNGRESEAAVAQRIIAEAGKLKLTSRLVASDAERPNAIVTWGKGARGFAIIGHIDTVAEGDHAMWTHPPFGGEIEGERMFGRGTADNKAGIAIGLYTLVLLRDHGLLDPSQVTIRVAGVVDEESGATSAHGVRYLVDQGHLPVQGAIYAYASDIICVGHRGSLRLELRARGESVHTGMKEWSEKSAGVNAVTGLAAVLLALEELEVPAPSHPAFDGFGCTITPGTLFQGGEFISIVPATAKAAVDIRLMPEQAVDELLQQVQKVIDVEVAKRPGLQIETTVTNSFPGAAIPIDHPLALLARGYTKEFTGSEWPVAGAGPGNEGYMLIAAGIPTLPGFGPTGGNAHAPDEWVSIPSLGTTLAIFAGMIRDYCSA